MILLLYTWLIFKGLMLTEFRVIYTANKILIYYMTEFFLAMVGQRKMRWSEWDLQMWVDQRRDTGVPLVLYTPSPRPLYKGCLLHKGTTNLCHIDTSTWCCTHALYLQYRLFDKLDDGIFLEIFIHILVHLNFHISNSDMIVNNIDNLK